MNYTLPLFPLSLVVFPGQTVPLHIFEPRYKELIAHCRKEGISFGILPVIDNAVKQVGTKVQLLDVVREYDDGRLDVKVQGVTCFRLRSFSEKGRHLYPEGEVEDLTFDETRTDEADELEAMVKDLYEIMRIDKNAGLNLQELYMLAHRIGLDIRDQYEILRCESTREQCQLLCSRLESLIPKIKEMEEIRRRIQLNGQFQPR
ncbi:MAG: LON peptidase substrate-binding domain-containing protein [Saprospiraceae bacterium]|nr:LON peptidase substrate-binding domain-containing protein [Saprospiraceae bacterium]